MGVYPKRKIMIAAMEKLLKQYEDKQNDVDHSFVSCPLCVACGADTSTSWGKTCDPCPWIQLTGDYCKQIIGCCRGYHQDYEVRINQLKKWIAIYKSKVKVKYVFSN